MLRPTFGVKFTETLPQTFTRLGWQVQELRKGQENNIFIARKKGREPQMWYQDFNGHVRRISVNPKTKSIKFGKLLQINEFCLITR